MKKGLLRTFVLSCVLCVTSVVYSQYVTLPDTNFVNWLSTSGYSQCLIGNMLDTTCPAVVNATGIGCNGAGIHNLTGIQYFDHLTSLFCQSNQLTALPPLPATLTSLDCLNNFISQLPPLPTGLQDLVCRDNMLDSLPALPNTLNHLDAVGNLLTTLPALPASLTRIDCSINLITVLPALPSGLQVLSCRGNQLDTLPVLPSSLNVLDCSSNAFFHLPVLPASLISLNCSYNLLYDLPVLPNALVTLLADVNNLYALPALPLSLKVMSVYSNHLSALPVLPPALVDLNASANALTYLPELPDSLYQLHCDGNPNLTCLPQLKRIVNLYFDSAVIACLPDYGNVTNSSPALATVPLCGIYNNNGCSAFWNISGSVYYDGNNDCIHDTTETRHGNIKVKLYDNGNLKQQVYSGGEGYYSFEVNNGTYTLQADTTGLPFTVSCPVNGFNTAVVTATDSQIYSNNFGLKCGQGFDVGANTFVRDSGLLRPANSCLIKILAGDLTNFYGAHCASGVSGQVQVTYNGPVTYQGVATGALSPDTIIGNTIFWNISDFGTINYFSAFHIRFKTDSSALPHQLVALNISVTPLTGDADTANNHLTEHLEIIVPHDPNEKEVSPAGDIDASQQWLTYTIHFQNTGTTSAQHIYVDDTLDNNLDESSFQLLAYSHQPLVQLKQNAIRFNFPNINLPDSGSNQTASHGYVQYKIKPKSNLAIGSTINNTASIYFDFNTPVVTNTVANTIATATGLEEIRNRETEISIYPNPASNSVNIIVGENMIGSNLIVSDVTGRKMFATKLETQNLKLEVQNFANGIYFITINATGGRSATKKLIINR